MNNKYIKLTFEDAILFPKNKKSKDFINYLEIKKNKLVFNKKKRSDVENNSFKEPITVHQISNMLHTLVGERPVPSFRETFYSRNEKIFNLAQNSFLKINTPKTIKKTKDETVEVFISELIKVKKSAKNSWSKHSTIQWFKVRKYLDNNFDEFINLINESLGYDVLTEPFENLLNIYKKHGDNLQEVIEFLKSIKRKPLINFLTNENIDRSEITRNKNLTETILSAIDYVYVLSGEILIPYNEKFVNKIIKSRTNILDGGLVKIEGIVFEDELNNTEDFKLVSEISDEKY